MAEKSYVSEVSDTERRIANLIVFAWEDLMDEEPVSDVSCLKAFDQLGETERKLVGSVENFREILDWGKARQSYLERQ